MAWPVEAVRATLPPYTTGPHAASAISLVSRTWKGWDRQRSLREPVGHSLQRSVSFPRCHLKIRSALASASRPSLRRKLRRERVAITAPAVSAGNSSSSSRNGWLSLAVQRASVTVRIFSTPGRRNRRFFRAGRFPSATYRSIRKPVPSDQTHWTPSGNT